MENKSKYKKAFELSNENFRRLTGITKELAVEMVLILSEAYKNKHKRRGRHCKLLPEDMLMMALKYWRQYPTFFELGFEFGISKTRAYELVVWVEDVLIKSEKFKLPGKKKLLEADNFEIILVDVMERPIERPKKNSENGILERKSVTHQKPK